MKKNKIMGEKTFQEDAKFILNAIVGLAWDLENVKSKYKDLLPEFEMVKIHEILYKTYCGLWESSGTYEGKWWGNYNLVFREGAIECRIFGDVDREGIPLEAKFRWKIMGSPPKPLKTNKTQEKLLKYLATYFIAEKKDVHKYYRILKEKMLV